MRSVDTSVPPSSPRRFGRFELQPGGRLLLADGAAGRAGSTRVRSAGELVERAGHAGHQGRPAGDGVAGARCRGEQPAGADLHAAQDSRAERASPPFPDAAIVSTFPSHCRRRRLQVPAVRASCGCCRRALRVPGPDARTNLPSRLPRLYGRAEDIAAIAALLRVHPVVTITGSGGIGKTRVAQAVAKRRDAECGRLSGRRLVGRARRLADGALVPSAVAQAIGVRLAGDRPAADSLRSQLAPQRALLVLDNCEHLAHAVAALVDTVMAGAPRVSILVTSQETLKASRRACLSAGRARDFASRRLESHSPIRRCRALRSAGAGRRSAFRADRGQPAGGDRDLPAPGRHSARDRARRRRGCPCSALKDCAHAFTSDSTC